jgi:hypothetical protein
MTAMKTHIIATFCPDSSRISLKRSPDRRDGGSVFPFFHLRHGY